MGLLFAGAFASYSLGANNIANVVGVFLPVSPFADLKIGSLFYLSSRELLFLIGGIAISSGVFTYSRQVMLTVGRNILKLSPVAAFVVVVSHSLVLLIFSSKGLGNLLEGWGFIKIPLVPVSSSQAIVGGILGIGLVKGGQGINWKILGGIGLGWVISPLIAALIALTTLFLWNNLFHL